VDLLLAAGVPQDKIKFAGKLADLVAGGSVLLDDEMMPDEGSPLQILIHLEQFNEAQGDTVTVDKIITLTQLPCPTPTP
jgi:hypothetical protein